MRQMSVKRVRDFYAQRCQPQSFPDRCRAVAARRALFSSIVITSYLHYTVGVISESNLNQEQFEAVTAITGPLLIIAGAGSGKTRVITFRIAHMLESGIPQNQILALTFTNKAAREMEERIHSLTQKKLHNLTVSTFHAFGVQILRAHIDALGWRNNFSIYDESDQKQLIKESATEIGFINAVDTAVDAKAIAMIFSAIKSGSADWDVNTAKYQKLYEAYQTGLKLYNACDFDDLIALPLRLFREHPEILQKYKDRYKYILVDEFQDTSLQQYKLLALIAKNEGASANIAVVGDDDQSIYSWRGANYRNIELFEKDFPDVREIRLEQNYRSTGTILAAANGVISHNTNRKDKALWSKKDSGKPIEFYLPSDEAAEAAFIAKMIHENRARENRKFDDFGILMRANHQSQMLEEALLDANIPYTMTGGTSFFARKEIKDIISYLRVCTNHNDDINLLRIINTPRRSIGRAAIAELGTLAKTYQCTLWDAMAHLSGTNEEFYEFLELITEGRKDLLGHSRGLAKKVRAFIEKIGYYDYLMLENNKSEKAARFKIRNIEIFLSSIDSWENNPDNLEPSLYAYLNRITLLSRSDLNNDDESGKVNMMTIHASKGLEFPIVFIAGAEDTLIPSARALEENAESIEEERRLFYVAITRAQEKLYISACQKRKKLRESVESSPSRFIEEIPKELITYCENETQENEDDLVLSMLASIRKARPPSNT
ncbi:MAG: UvrD-helicase domain-containing protein [Treponemataceae bacterium]|nr:MAG: UvrD-helicase domain-containing protein [Treponemataceae bacterium]